MRRSRSNTKGFRRTARRVHKVNHWMGARGGIRM